MIGLQSSRHFQPIEVKKTAKTASRTMTRKIDWTTAVVVREPTCSDVALDQHALEAAGERDDEAEHRRLDQRRSTGRSSGSLPGAAGCR